MTLSTDSSYGGGGGGGVSDRFSFHDYDICTLTDYMVVLILCNEIFGYFHQLCGA